MTLSRAHRDPVFLGGSRSKWPNRKELDILARVDPMDPVDPDPFSDRRRIRWTTRERETKAFRTK